MVSVSSAVIWCLVVAHAFVPARRHLRHLGSHRTKAPRAVSNEGESVRRLATLVTVPMVRVPWIRAAVTTHRCAQVWGTYAPVVRYVYELPVPPPGVLFSAAYYGVAMSTLAVAQATLSPRLGSDEASLANRAGFELGTYLFVGNMAQVLGLQSTSASAAAFLVQTTTVIVPTLEAILRGSLPARTRNACAVAFMGVAVICGNDLGDLSGDALIVLASLFYSFHVIRLGTYAPRLDAVNLAFAKAKYETGFAVATVAAIWLFLPANDLRSFLAADFAPSERTALFLATFWSGTVVCAYTIWAQSYGQRDVPPARANLIYTSQPIFSSLFAALLVGEKPTLAAALGGALIVLAIFIEIDGAVEVQRHNDIARRRR